MDSSAELGPMLLSYYETQIDVLIWMVELGRIDIINEVSMLALQLALPREGHLEAVLQFFVYMKGHHNTRMLFDPTYPNTDISVSSSDRPDPRCSRGKSLNLQRQLRG